MKSLAERLTESAHGELWSASLRHIPAVMLEAAAALRQDSSDASPRAGLDLRHEGASLRKSIVPDVEWTKQFAAPHAPSAWQQPDTMIAALKRVYSAARGLCFGVDWNNGTHAKAHGYRQQLIDAVHAIEPMPGHHSTEAAALRASAEPVKLAILSRLFTYRWGELGMKGPVDFGAGEYIRKDELISALDAVQSAALPPSPRAPSVEADHPEYCLCAKCTDHTAITAPSAKPVGDAMHEGNLIDRLMARFPDDELVMEAIDSVIGTRSANRRLREQVAALSARSAPGEKTKGEQP